MPYSAISCISRGADLQFDALLARADDRGVDRAVVVLLRRRDVVLEARRAPSARSCARRRARGSSPRSCRRRTRKPKMSDSCSKPIALRSILRQIEYGCFCRPLTFAVDAACRRASWSAAARSRSTTLCVARRERREPLADHRDRLPGLSSRKARSSSSSRMLVHAHAAGERRIDVERLLGDAPARFRRHEVERAHVVQPVGELDQQHAHVVGDRQQQLAQVLGLLRLLGDEVELLQLGQAVDQRADLAARTARRSRRASRRCPRSCRAAARPRSSRRRA